MTAIQQDLLVAIDANPVTCQALAAGRALRIRQAELANQQQRVRRLVAEARESQRAKAQRIYGRDIDRARQRMEKAADRYGARLQALPAATRTRVRAAIGPDAPEGTPMKGAPLSPAMRTALVAVGQPIGQGPAVLSCKVGTVQALVRRGLAYTDTELGPVLTSDGLHEAAKLIDQGRSLQRCDVVIYQGSFEREHGNEFAVLGEDSNGRFAIVDTYNGSCVLQNVRRSSLRYIGRAFDPETGCVA